MRPKSKKRLKEDEKRENERKEDKLVKSHPRLNQIGLTLENRASRSSYEILSEVKLVG